MKERKSTNSVEQIAEKQFVKSQSSSVRKIRHEAGKRDRKHTHRRVVLNKRFVGNNGKKRTQQNLPAS